MKSKIVTFQVKTIEQCFPVAMFSMLNRVVLTFESMDVSEPTINYKIFSPNLVPLPSHRSSIIDSFSSGSKETLQHYAKFWCLFRSVMWPIPIPFLSVFSHSFSLFLDFIIIVVVEFSITQLFYSGLLDIE